MPRARAQLLITVNLSCVKRFGGDSNPARALEEGQATAWSAGVVPGYSLGTMVSRPGRDAHGAVGNPGLPNPSLTWALHLLPWFALAARARDVWPVAILAS